MIFANRAEAGRLLAERLAEYRYPHPVILALPKGGVPVAAEIASDLGGDLDILLVKRITSPLYREVAIGAITEDGSVLWQEDSLKQLGLAKREVASLAKEKKAELYRQAEELRPGRSPVDVRNRVVILVDDGLATGSSMKAAIESLQKRKPSKIVVAVPVAPISTANEIRPLVDDFIVLNTPDTFYAVGQWYEDFKDVSVEDVTSLLRGKKTPRRQEDRELIVDGDVKLPGILTLVPNARGLVIFAHGSASSHKSPRNIFVAKSLNSEGFSTLLFDLLTEKENTDRRNTFDIGLLARRLTAATRWVRARFDHPKLNPNREKCPPIAYFGASTGGAAAIAAAADDESIYAVVGRGSRPDLAGDRLDRIQAPVLLIVGGKDEAIMPANREAAERIRTSELVVIPGATHLFEETGTLEKVAEYAIEWFEDSLESALKGSVPKAEEKIVRELRTLAHPLRAGSDLETWLDKMSGARVVMLGEASHGTNEFYALRKEITERLIEDYGFSFVAVEGDWPDCYKFTRYIKSGEGGSALQVANSFSRWPEWLWNNEVSVSLIESLRKTGTPFYGLDIYSLYDSIERMMTYAERLPQKLRDHIYALSTCFEPYDRSEDQYARRLTREPAGCEREISELLQDLLRTRFERITGDETDFLDAKQNARVIYNAEQYYRAMLFGGADSWNVRDRHMIDTLDTLLRHHDRQIGGTSRAIIWAHNTHIGDYHATDMVDAGYVNLGGLARERYGVEQVHLVGFGTYEGTVLAGHGWGAVPEIMNVAPAIPGSYEAYLHETAKEIGVPELFLPELGSSEDPSLAIRRGHRAIGVVYQESANPKRNFVPTALSRRYDSFVFVDRTTALRDLAYKEQKPGRLPETWPTGM